MFCPNYKLGTAGKMRPFFPWTWLFFRPQLERAMPKPPPRSASTIRWDYAADSGGDVRRRPARMQGRLIRPARN